MNLRVTAKSLMMGGLLLIGSGLLISCMPNTAAPVLQPRTPTTAPVRAEADPTATLRAALPPFTDGACLACHTDKDRLVALAKTPEETEALSEGPG